MANEINMENVVEVKLESGIVGAMLQNEEVLSTATSLNQRDFSSPQIGDIFSALVEIYKQTNSLPTVDDVIDYLADLHGDTPAGRRALSAEKTILKKISDDSNNTISDWGVLSSQKKIRELAARKRWQAASDAIAKGADPIGVAEKLNEKFSRLTKDPEKEITRQSVEGMKKLADDYKNVMGGIPFGIEALDRQQNIFFSPGTLTVLMAASNVGKSFFCSHMNAYCLKNKLGVLYITLEMSKGAVGMRIMSNITGIPLTNHPDTPDKLAAGFELCYNNTPGGFSDGLTFEYPPKFAKSDDIQGDIELYKREFGKLPDLVIIDGISDMALQGEESGFEGYGRVAGELNGLAKKYSLPILTTTQANREAMKDKSEVIGLEKIGESIQIAQRADTVISLSPKKGSTNRVFLHIAKARHGRKDETFEIKQDLRRGKFCMTSKSVKDSDGNVYEEPNTGFEGADDLDDTDIAAATPVTEVAPIDLTISPSILEKRKERERKALREEEVEEEKVEEQEVEGQELTPRERTLKALNGGRNE